ncbi:MAG: exo-alpha-sialidase, partial [Pirellulales bacterium]|nr:exo-alpha-sialidase [Pirellulales bacterium]
PDWTWYATGPGAGIQLRNSRLIIPCDHRGPDKDGYYSHVIYSDDAGKTWQIGGTARPAVNECEAVELADGRLMLNMRNYDRQHHTRAVATSDDGGLSWSDVTHDPALIEPICQASIRRYSLASGGRGQNQILFSNPASTTDRERMTVRLSLDEARTWPVARVLHPGPSAYSCLAVLPNGRILCLYECGKKFRYETLTLADFDLAWLKGK